MSPRLPKRTVLAVALATAALLVAAAPLATAAPATQLRAGVPACKSSNLVVWILNGAGSGTAGSFYYKLEITNLTRQTCTLRGYPKAFPVGLSGKRVGPSASREPGKQRTVTLGPRESAKATLRMADPGAFSPSECHAVLAAGLRVTAPGGTTSQFVPFPSETCSRQPTQSVISVGPFS